MAGVQTPTDIGEGQGPNASMEFGVASQTQDLANSLKNQAPGAYAATQVPSQSAPNGMQPPAPPGQQPQQPPSAPVQPPPNTNIPVGLQQVLNQIFSPPQVAEPPWREGLQNFAQHGTYLDALARLAAPPEQQS